MLGCNQNITVWLRKKVPEVNKEIFVRRILPVKCRWRNYSERDTSNGTVNIYNNVVIIVPYFEDEAGLSIYDLKEGDIAALGIWDIDITGVSPYTAIEVRRLIFPNITVINSVSYNDDNNNNNTKGKHLRLTGN